MGVQITWISLFYIAGLFYVSALNVNITGQTRIEPGVPYTLSCFVNESKDDRSTFYTISTTSLIQTVTIRYDPSIGCYYLESGRYKLCTEDRCSCDANGLATHWIYDTPSDLSSAITFRCSTSNENGIIFNSINVLMPTLALAPTTAAVITQIPPGPIISGNKVTLTCSVSGGNPLAVLSWNCTGNYNNDTSGNTSSYSVDFPVDKTYNNKICTCSGSHPVSSYRPTVHHRLAVYYAPDIKPTVKQTPKGVIVPGNKVTLTCSVLGGHPLAVLVWDCSSTNTNNTSENTSSYSIEFYTNTTYNNRICTCSATHPVTSYRPLVQHKLAVFFSPQYIQIEERNGLFTAGISSLVIGVLALALAVVFISCRRFRMKKKSKSEDNYTEFSTKASTETVAYNVINQTTNIDNNRPSIEDKVRGVYSYDECQPYSSNTDHTPSDKSQQSKVSDSSPKGEEYDYVKV